MDMSFLSSMFGGGASPDPAKGYYFGDTPKMQVQQGVATGASLPAGTVMPGGAVASGTTYAEGSTPLGRGEGLPPGATAGLPKTQNSMSGQSGVGAGLADSLKAIGDMIANYQLAGAANEQIPAAKAPQMVISPSLATFSIPQISRR